MKVLIILGHPDNTSFNHAIACTCKKEIENNGHSVFFHDLYNEKFNPLLQIDSLNQDIKPDENLKTHIEDLTNSDAIIVIHPNWWGQPPAIIKGWLDRVLVQGIAYDFIQNEKGEYIPIGLLKAKIALILNTSNTPDDLDNEILNDPLDSIWKERVFKFCGVNQIVRKNFSTVKNSNVNQRSQWLSEIEILMNTHFPKVI